MKKIRIIFFGLLMGIIGNNIFAYSEGGGVSSQTVDPQPSGKSSPTSQLSSHSTSKSASAPLEEIRHKEASQLETDKEILKRLGDYIKAQVLPDLDSLTGNVAYEHADSLLEYAETTEDEKKAFIYLHYSGQKRYPDALYRLSNNYKLGFSGCINKDPVFGRELCNMAAEAGNPMAQIGISLAYIDGNFDLVRNEENKKKGFELLEKYAKKGNAKAGLLLQQLQEGRSRSNSDIDDNDSD